MLVEKVKAILSSRLKINDIGAARWGLGIRLRQAESAFILDQAQYITTILKRSSKYMKRTRSIKIPVPNGFDSHRDTVAIILPYRELLGSLGHLAIGTRIDIAFPIILLSRFASRPQKKEWDAEIHVMRYAENEFLSLPYSTGRRLNEFDMEQQHCGRQSTSITQVIGTRLDPWVDR